MQARRPLAARSFALPRLGLAAALISFVVVGWLQTDSFGTWHEELSVYPSVGYRVLDRERPEADVTWQPRCGGPDERTLIWSRARPRLSLCAGELSLPIMVESYFSGLFYWPSALAWSVHHGDAFSLRKLALGLGLLGLVLTYMLVTRLRDETTAAIVALVTAVSSPFIYLHGLLVHYEVLPWMFLVGALLIVGPRNPTTSRRRIVLAALLLGLGCLANVKMILLVAPLAGLVLARKRQWLRDVGEATFGYAAAAALVGCAPLWIFALIDPEQGVGSQTAMRITTLLERADLRLVPLELVNELTFGADVGAYFTGDGTAHPALLVPGALAGVWAIVHLVRWLKGRPADPLGVLCGASLCSYYLVSLLLYAQTPAANYSPLHTVFGMTVGGAVAALGRWMAARAPSERLPAGAIGAALAIVVAGGSTAVLAWRMDVAEAMEMPVNPVAQHRLREHLVERVAPDRTIVSTTYNLAGVVESLSGGRLRAVQAHLIVDPCLYESGDALDACLDGPMAEILDVTGGAGVAFLAPVMTSQVDEPGVAALLPALDRAARARGLEVIEEARFEAASGAPILSLRRLRHPSDRRGDGQEP